MHIEVLNHATDIVKTLNCAGFTAYFAGGWVRDHMMGHPSDDIDIATDAPPEIIVDLFQQTILVGIAFGVVVVVIDGHQFEVATFRKDIDYVNGRAPSQIELSTAEEDAKRRDFTINGMFYDPIEHVIHDFVDGAQDIQRGVIRAIGNAYERFVEDRLRMVRAVRFAARFGFSIDPETQEAIAASAETLFPAVALERIWQELVKMSKYPNFDTALINLHRLKLLPVVFPALKGQHLHDIQHIVSSFKNFPAGAETILQLMELFPKATVIEAKELCKYLRTSNAESNVVEYLVHLRQGLESEDVLKITDLPLWTHLYANPAAKKCLEVIAAKLPLDERKVFLEKHSGRMEMLKKHIDRIIDKKPLINAAILQAEGVQPGRTMGILMKEAERMVIMNSLNDVDQILEILKSTHVWPKERNI